MQYTGPLSLLTDLYELTMMQGYYFLSPEDRSVFYMFFRRPPFQGGYTVFSGLEPLLHVLENFSFSGDDIEYLKNLGMFRDEFLRFLKSFRFSGSVYSLREGTPVFPLEPLIKIEGTLMESQLVESIVLNQLNFQTLVATKASRIVEAAGRLPVMEFGLRRAHGIDGSLSSSRAAYIGGAVSTSNTLAGKLLGIPVSGTMAHSWVMSFNGEYESFEEYSRLYPDRCVLLVDTYDTMRSGIPNAIRVFQKMKSKGTGGFKAIRIDSGDFEILSKGAREALDGAGLGEVKILVSSDLDEYTISELLQRNSPIDGWGIGTRMVTAWDDPALTGVYKISARSSAGGPMEPCIKLSDQSEKNTLPGDMNIVRFFNEKEKYLCDCICLEEETVDLLDRIARHEPVRVFGPGLKETKAVLDRYGYAETLITLVMNKGTISSPHVPIEQVRLYREQCIDRLDPRYKVLKKPDMYPVYLSERLHCLRKDIISAIRAEYLA